MKLKDCRDAYNLFSSKASDITRNLGLAGIAIIWIFRETNADRATVPEALIPVGIFLLFGLAFDFLQYVTATVVWGCYHRYKEQRVAEEDEFLAPRQINWATNTFFALKTIAIAMAYIGFIRFFIKQMC